MQLQMGKDELIMTCPKNAGIMQQEKRIIFVTLICPASPTFSLIPSNIEYLEWQAHILLEHTLYAESNKNDRPLRQTRCKTYHMNKDYPKYYSNCLNQCKRSTHHALHGISTRLRKQQLSQVVQITWWQLAFYALLRTQQRTWSHEAYTTYLYMNMASIFK